MTPSHAPAMPPRTHDPPSGDTNHALSNDRTSQTKYAPSP